MSEDESKWTTINYRNMDPNVLSDLVMKVNQERQNSNDSNETVMDIVAKDGHKYRVRSSNNRFDVQLYNDGATVTQAPRPSAPSTDNLSAFSRYTREMEQKKQAQANLKKKAVFAANRKLVKMALITDASGLTEFIKGELYKVKDTGLSDRSEFITILNDKGDERELRRRRVTIVEVYDTPPVEEEAMTA